MITLVSKASREESTDNFEGKKGAASPKEKPEKLRYARKLAAVKA